MPLSKTWFLASVPALLLALVLLTLTVRHLVRATGNSIVATLPVTEEQRFRLPEAGEFRISGETALLHNAFSEITFSVSDPAGTPVPVQRTFVGVHSSSLSRLRQELYRFAASAPGEYTLTLRGPGLASAGAETRILIARPLGGTIVIHVIGIVLFAAVMIGSLVLSGLVLSGK